MTPTVHAVLLAVSHLQTPKVAAAGAALMTFIIADLTTGQALFGALCALVSAALAAYLASRPGLRQARVAEGQLHNTVETQLDERKDKTHAAEVAFLQSRIEYNARVAALTRVSKHNLLGETQRLTSHIHKLRELMREAKVECPEFEFKYYDDLCGDEDRGLALLTPPAEFEGRDEAPKNRER
ncbi:MAG TPA: hypothetical protein VFS10_10845 [Pyrinomonadaceae bacterium]|nr:hypothetical protein [Pyrinomonadaceae bacterium]